MQRQTHRYFRLEDYRVALQWPAMREPRGGDPQKRFHQRRGRFLERSIGSQLAGYIFVRVASVPVYQPGMQHPVAPSASLGPYNDAEHSR
ncbi:MAG: hypothetical protein M5U09_09990 [Gammaproteobacteria bacterium]|nr:hypothetical protein [Gammaproteobacteria bacterium]